MKKKRYEKISALLWSIDRLSRKSKASKHEESMLGKHRDSLLEIVRTSPSGGGFDNGTNISDKSTPEKIVFETHFHHMDDNGYCRWTYHEVTLTPSFVFGWNMKVSGKNKNDIKDYIGEVFGLWLNEEVEDNY